MTFTDSITVGDTIGWFLLFILLYVLFHTGARWVSTVIAILALVAFIIKYGNFT